MVTEAVRRQSAIVSGEQAAERSGSRWGIRKRSVLSAVVVVTFSLLVSGKSDNSHRALFSDASHELRSPLSTLVTTAEVASLDQSGRTWLDMQQTVLNESSRIQSLVEDLLTLAKVDAHQLQLDIQDVDLEDVLDAEIKRLRTVSSLQVNAELQPTRVRGDERRLMQVFRNLMDNAARHAKSTIMVGMERRPVRLWSRSTMTARSSV